MRRISTALASVLALALAVPGLALADHHHGRGGHHHSGHHGHAHAKGARVISFAPVTGGSKGGQGTAGAAPESVGTVQSYEAEVLTIKLADGTVISGKVTEQTHVCVVPPPTTSGQGQKEGDEDDEQQGDDDGQDGAPEGSSGGEPQQEVGEDDHHGSWSGQDDSSGDEGWDGGDGQCCKSSTSALVAGATVLAAELRLTSSGSVWESVVVQ